MDPTDGVGPVGKQNAPPFRDPGQRKPFSMAGNGCTKQISLLPLPLTEITRSNR